MFSWVFINQHKPTYNCCNCWGVSICRAFSEWKQGFSTSLCMLTLGHWEFNPKDIKKHRLVGYSVTFSAESGWIPAMLSADWLWRIDRSIAEMLLLVSNRQVETNQFECCQVLALWPSYRLVVSSFSISIVDDLGLQLTPLWGNGGHRSMGDRSVGGLPWS